MKNNESIRIAVAETSVIIRSGLTLALKRLPNLKIQLVELLSVEALNDCLRTQFPDILVVNPTFGDFFDVARFREETAGKGIRVVALVSLSMLRCSVNTMRLFLFSMIWRHWPIKSIFCRISSPKKRRTVKRI